MRRTRTTAVLGWAVLAAVRCSSPESVPADVPTDVRRLPDGAPCPIGTMVCPDDPWDSCGRDVQSDPNNCGYCQARCEDNPASVVTSCNMGHCERLCREAAADCDHDPTTACDTDISTDARNCGGCGRPCAAGESCVAARCVATGARLKAPISALRLRSARPWFRWELPPGAEGVRLEVCSTRACTTVEHRWDVSGSNFRSPTPLEPGVHFWRVTARRGEALDATPSLTWEFEIGLAGNDSHRALLDVNGDGVGDAAAGIFHGHSSWAGSYWGHPTGHAYSVSEAIALGDMNGDGYGDVGYLEFDRSFGRRFAESLQTGTLYLFRGGPDGLTRVPLALTLGDSTGSVTIVPVADRNGDGYGDVTTALVDFSGSADIVDLWGGAVPRSALSARLGPFLWIDHGDFNADGFEDVVASWERDALGFYRFSQSVGGSFTYRWNLECVSEPPVANGYDFVPTVRDRDDDGYDDLLVTDRQRMLTSIFSGGPMGLDGARCTTVTTAP